MTIFGRDFYCWFYFGDGREYYKDSSLTFSHEKRISFNPGNITYILFISAVWHKSYFYHAATFRMILATFFLSISKSEISHASHIYYTSIRCMCWPFIEYHFCRYDTIGNFLWLCGHFRLSPQAIRLVVVHHSTHPAETTIKKRNKDARTMDVEKKWEIIDNFSDYCTPWNEKRRWTKGRKYFFYSMRISFIWNGSLSNYLLFIVCVAEQKKKYVLPLNVRNKFLYGISIFFYNAKHM